MPHNPHEIQKSPDYGSSISGLKVFNQSQKDAVKGILDSISGLTDLKFDDKTGAESNGDASALIHYAERKTSDAYASYPSEKNDGGDAWFTNSGFYDAPEIGTKAYAGIMHETGHTLGLKHSFENSGNGTVPSSHDSLEYTLMSYSSYAGAKTWSAKEGDYPQTLMMDDIAALQRMYGADYSSHQGNTTYTWNPITGSMNASDGLTIEAPNTSTIFMTIWDGSGQSDTYNFGGSATNGISAFSSGLIIDLRPGEWVQTTDNSQTADLGFSDKIAEAHPAAGIIANALTVKTYDVNGTGNVISENPASLIENATGGTGADTFVANQAA